MKFGLTGLFSEKIRVSRNLPEILPIPMKREIYSLCKWPTFHYLPRSILIMISIQKPVLRLGSQGDDVKELQTLLNKHNYQLSVNGVFGELTDCYVKGFQFTHFLEADGIVGEKTWRALYKGAPVDMPVLKAGSKEQEAIKIVQTILANLSKSFNEFLPYYSGEINSVYGPQTESAVKDFQTNSGLVADGMVGERTWHGLCKHGHLRYYAEDVYPVC
jgi:peptidoglycan hydrolase-like protein with peptidoglycan-binding domain